MIETEDGINQSPLDDYFAKEWTLLDRRHGSMCFRRWTLEDVGSVNQRAGVREERWSSLDLKQLKFPQSTVSSVKRATVIQHFEADFIRAMGIISPSAGLCARAVFAGVQRHLLQSTYNCRQLGYPQECWDLARILRRDPRVRLTLMTAYRRLLPAKSCEEDELHQNAKGPVVVDQRSSFYISEASALEKRCLKAEAYGSYSRDRL